MKLHPAWSWALCVAVLGGCGGGGSDDGGMTDCTCNPACKAGFHCSCEGAGGCVPDQPGMVDLSVPATSQDGQSVAIIVQQSSYGPIIGAGRWDRPQ